jgi:hypothetical protein
MVALQNFSLAFRLVVIMDNKSGRDTEHKTYLTYLSITFKCTLRLPFTGMLNQVVWYFNDGDSVILQNVQDLLPDCMLLHPRRMQA